MIAERPILILPEPERTKRDVDLQHPVDETVHRPPRDRQIDRIGVHMVHLENVRSRDQAYLQTTPDGAMPEHVLVLEIIGDVPKFINAINRTPGLEWLGEFEEEDIPPDDDFYRTTASGGPLNGRLYLIMANHAAIDQLLSLWDCYKTGKKFPFGQTKWRDIFDRLKDVRMWGVQDRLNETGVIEDWRHRIANKEETVRFEIELWYRRNAGTRQEREAEIAALVNARNGKVISSAVIDDIAYHAILAELPIGEIQGIIENANDHGDLVKCEEVMFFRPSGQCAATLAEGQTIPVGDRPPYPIAGGEPVVALLDGLPLENHHLLRNRIIIDDPGDWQVDYQAQHRQHGTAMASLILHGELDTDGAAATRPIYARPILRPNLGVWSGPAEQVPEDALPVDLVHRAVRRIFEGDGVEAAAAPTVKIVNLSVGDASRPFDNILSPWARLLDWLAFRYQVLFVVSAGNHVGQDIELDVLRDAFRGLSAEQRERAVIASLAGSVRHRRLLSPSEAVNVLTVGALHKDASSIGATRLINPYNDDRLPSPINGLGLGYRRSVKPEVLVAGGRVLYDEKLGNAHPHATLELRSTAQPPGQRVATPGTSGGLAQTCYRCGTSNAAALTSRLAAQYHEILEDLRGSDSASTLREDCISALLKAMVVHGAAWDEAADVLADVLRNGQSGRGVKDHVARFMGYGGINAFLLAGCTAQRATLLGCGVLADGDGDVFEIPLPPSLNAKRVWRQLTITLAWFTPIEPANRKYRKAQLWFDPPASSLALRRQHVDSRTTKRGTVQHEILEGRGATAFEEDGILKLKVSCRADAGSFSDAIPYGIALSLRVAEEESIPIYNEIRERIRARIRPEA